MLQKFFGYCLHRNLGKIEDGYQYCIECGKALPVLPPEPKICDHKWTIIGKVKKRGFFGVVKEKIFFLQCKECGEVKSVNSNEYKY
jgi:hypothetical protein